MSASTEKIYHSVIVGGGPAGTGPLVYGAWSGRLPELLDKGVCLIEAGPDLCTGSVGDYVINSNSIGATFLECLDHAGSERFLGGVSGCQERRTLEEYRTRTLPLRLVVSYLRVMGHDLVKAFDPAPQSEVMTRTRVTRITHTPDGGFRVTAMTDDGDRRVVRGRRLLLAPGGKPAVSRRMGRLVMAACVDNEELPMLMVSEDFLKHKGAREAEAWLSQFPQPRVVILGGSHSAFSCAWTLLNRCRLGFDEGAIHVLHRSDIRLYYPSVEEAHADGYEAFGDADTGEKGEVSPMAGLRGDAKHLYRQIVGMDADTEERRARLERLPVPLGSLAETTVPWGEVGLVIFANGYTFPELRIDNAAGNPLALAGTFTDRFVDQESRLLDATGVPVPGAYAVGMATGFLPTEMLGGEGSFSGKENSVWLCQHMLGEALFDALQN